MANYIYVIRLGDGTYVESFSVVNGVYNLTSTPKVGNAYIYRNLDGVELCVGLLHEKGYLAIRVAYPV